MLRSSHPEIEVVHRRLTRPRRSSEESSNNLATTNSKNNPLLSVLHSQKLIKRSSNSSINVQSQKSVKLKKLKQSFVEWHFSTRTSNSTNRRLIAVASPSDLCVMKKFARGQWFPAKTDLMDDPDGRLPGVPKGLEFLAMANHFYVQRCFRRDFPEMLPIQIDPKVSNRYQIICGDTRNRIYYAVAEYPNCAGWLNGYKPFRIYVFTTNQEVVFEFTKSVSCSLFWCFGGYGTKMTVRGPHGKLLGTIVQRFSFRKPCWDIMDENGKAIMCITGPPIIPSSLSSLQYLSKFKLHEVTTGVDSSSGSQQRHKNLRQIGVYLESSFGLGNCNLRNSLRIGFPRTMQYQRKAVVLASLFLLFFTYYELGNEYPAVSSLRQQLKPLLRMNPLYAPRLSRPYGYVKGKCNPYYTAIFIGIVVFLVTYFCVLRNKWEFSYVSLHRSK